MSEKPLGAMPQNDDVMKKDGSRTQWPVLWDTAMLIGTLCILVAGFESARIAWRIVQWDDSEVEHVEHAAMPWLEAWPIPIREFWADVLVVGTIACCVTAPLFFRSANKVWDIASAWIDRSAWRFALTYVFGGFVLGAGFVIIFMPLLARIIEDTLFGHGILSVRILPERGFINPYNWVDFTVVVIFLSSLIIAGFVLMFPGLSLIASAMKSLASTSSKRSR